MRKSPFSAGGLASYPSPDHHRELVPRPTVQQAAGGFFADAHPLIFTGHPGQFPFSPLLEEEWHLSRFALVPDRPHPIRVHRPSTGAALAANDDPVDHLEHIDGPFAVPAENRAAVPQDAIWTKLSVPGIVAVVQVAKVRRK